MFSQAKTAGLATLTAPTHCVRRVENARARNQARRHHRPAQARARRPPQERPRHRARHHHRRARVARRAASAASQSPANEHDPRPLAAGSGTIAPPSFPSSAPPINREQYAELARLSANLNQLTKLANSGQSVIVADPLLQRLASEVGRLRLALLGAGGCE